MITLSQAARTVGDLVTGNGSRSQFTPGQMEVWELWFIPLAVHFAEKFTDWEQVEDHFIEPAAPFRTAFEKRWDVTAKHFGPSDPVGLWSYLAFFWLWNSLTDGLLTAEDAPSPAALRDFLSWYEDQKGDQ